MMLIKSIIGFVLLFLLVSLLLIVNEAINRKENLAYVMANCGALLIKAAIISIIMVIASVIAIQLGLHNQ